MSNGSWVEYCFFGVLPSAFYRGYNSVAHTKLRQNHNEETDLLLSKIISVVNGSRVSGLLAISSPEGEAYCGHMKEGDSCFEDCTELQLDRL